MISRLKKHKKTILLLLLTLIGFGGVYFASLRKEYSNRANQKEGTFLVVATTGMIGDAVEQITQGRAEVRTLMGAGVDPHGYQASPQDGYNIAAADVVFYNGLHLEGSLHETLEASALYDPVYAVSNALDKEKDLIKDPASNEASDPHIWHDVQLWKKAVSYISEKLQKHDPANATFYKENTASYLRELEALDQDIRKKIRSIAAQRRILVTAHDAFEYFGRAYGVAVRGLQNMSRSAEPGLKDRVALKDFIKENGIHTIFPELGVNEKSMDALIESCQQEGLQVSKAMLFSDSLGAKGGIGGTYIEMMRWNVKTIVKGLKKKHEK